MRWFIVTPDMHRVHHPVQDDKINCHCGFNLPRWDGPFSTCRALPCAGHEPMTIGIRGHLDPREVSRLPGMLMLPFRGGVEGWAIKRRHWPEGGVGRTILRSRMQRQPPASSLAAVPPPRSAWPA